MMFRKASSGALDLFDQIQSDVFAAMDLVGAQIADDWKELIAVDVEYKGATVVVRSSPGEPPRRESGDLYNSIEDQTESDDATITLSISSDIIYAPMLEDGTSKMAPRPHCERTFEKWSDEVVDSIAHAIESA